MRRVSETNIFLRNNNCTTTLSTARCYLEATDDFSDFPFHTKTVLENIHLNKARGYYTKLSDTKNSDILGNELDECGLLSLFSARW